MQMTTAFSLKTRVIPGFFLRFCSTPFKVHSTHAPRQRNEIFCIRAIAKSNIYFDPSHIFKILPNIRSTLNGKKGNTGS